MELPSVKFSRAVLNLLGVVVFAITTGIFVSRDAGGQTPPQNIEVWTLGSPFSDVSTGRLRFNFAFCSACASTIDFVNAFSSLPIRNKRVLHLKLFTAEKSGSYGKGPLLAVEVRDLQGNLRRTVTASPIELESIPELVSQDLPVSNVLTNSFVSPGEYLAAHVYGPSGPGGSLNVSVHIQAEVVPR
jgi:hypothetical protein